MNIVPSEFSKLAWDYFLFAKKLAQNNYHQNIDSEHLFISILQNDKSIKNLLELNNINIKKIEEFTKQLILSLIHI